MNEDNDPLEMMVARINDVTTRLALASEAHSMGTAKVVPSCDDCGWRGSAQSLDVATAVAANHALSHCSECGGTPASCGRARIKCCPDCKHTSGALIPAVRELRDRIRSVLDDELANLADDGARTSHSVVRRMEAALAPQNEADHD